MLLKVVYREKVMRIEEERVEKNNMRYREGRERGKRRRHEKGLEIIVVIAVGGCGGDNSSR
jgi:hypothetical protein